MNAQGSNLDSPTRENGSRTRAWHTKYTTIALLVVALTLLVAVLLPAYENASRPSVHREAEIINSSKSALVVTAFDATKSATYKTSVEPGKSSWIDLAWGEGHLEVESRTIQIVVSDLQGKPFAVQALTGDQLNRPTIVAGPEWGKLQILTQDTAAQNRGNP